MKKKYTISVDGCDDFTETNMYLNSKELRLIRELTKKINANVISQCNPSMSVKLKKNK